MQGHELIARAPRPWISRRRGECAFPVAGQGWSTLSCCNPCGEAVYCREHHRRARRPGACLAALERELRALGLID